MKNKSSLVRKIIRENIKCDGPVLWNSIFHRIWPQVLHLFMTSDIRGAMTEVQSHPDFIVTTFEGAVYISASRPCEHPECVIRRTHQL